MTSRSLFFVVLLPALSACQQPPVYVNSTDAPGARTITVSGAARVELVPDEACVELTLVSRESSMETAHEQLTRHMTSLLAVLTDDSLSVERGSVRYAPDYQRDANGRSRLVGHAASAQVNVRTQDFERIPDVVGHAASRGLDRVDVVFYSTELVARKSEVRRQALEAARDKAGAMADTLGVELGQVMSITEGQASTRARIEVANYVAAADTDSLPDTPPQPGSIPLTVQVGVVYALD